MWSERFIALARTIGAWSKDPSTQVGAVIVDDKRRIVGTGYNGFPRDVLDDEYRYSTKHLKHEMVIHAEVNAVLNSVKSTEGCTLYATAFPCPRCAGVLIQAGIKRVVAAKCPGYDERWAQLILISQQMFNEAGVRYEVCDGRLGDNVNGEQCSDHQHRSSEIYQGRNP